jgi:hypothetical protein
MHIIPSPDHLHGELSDLPDNFTLVTAGCDYIELLDLCHNIPLVTAACRYIELSDLCCNFTLVTADCGYIESCVIFVTISCW